VSRTRYRSSHRGRRVAAVLAFLLAAGVAAAAAAPTGERLAGSLEIAEGVEIAGVPVGGLTAEEAQAKVERSFARPVALRYDERAWHLTPAELGAEAEVSDAVQAALAAPAETTVRLRVRQEPGIARAWVAEMARAVDRPARSSRILLRRARPFVTRSQTGLRVDRRDAARRLATALELHARGPLDLPVRMIEPKLTRKTAGPLVVVRRDSHRLVLYDGMRRVRRFGVATGQASYPTPTGSFKIVTKQRDPWWYPPASDWARGLSPVPPGPGNPLGTRWMGISAPAVGLHGTPDAASIGYSASHGCVRMQIADAEWLFERVKVGTPVFIVAA
jgi:lipoprotein-anchoring transpeptidase ErfK/SrfK